MEFLARTNISCRHARTCTASSKFASPSSKITNSSKNVPPCASGCQTASRSNRSFGARMNKSARKLP